MFYAAMNELSENSQWDTKTLESRYKIWVSQYPDTAYPETPKSSYEGTHAMWQYTNKGKVSGIDKPVDLNVAYFGFDETESAKMVMRLTMQQLTRKQYEVFGCK